MSVESAREELCGVCGVADEFDRCEQRMERVQAGRGGHLHGVFGAERLELSLRSGDSFLCRRLHPFNNHADVLGSFLLIRFSLCPICFFHQTLTELQHHSVLSNYRGNEYVHVFDRLRRNT